MHGTIELPAHLNEARMLDAARRYAAADASDPFALARAICHIRQRLCGPCEDPDMLWRNGNSHKAKMTKIGPPAGSDGHYDARQAINFYYDVKRT